MINYAEVCWHHAPHKLHTTCFRLACIYASGRTCTETPFFIEKFDSHLSLSLSLTPTLIPYTTRVLAKYKVHHLKRGSRYCWANKGRKTDLEGIISRSLFRRGGGGSHSVHLLEVCSWDTELLIERNEPNSRTFSTVNTSMTHFETTHRPVTGNPL